jgi:restriction system protein
MAIPDFQSCMLPLLELARDGHEHSLAGAREVLAAHLRLSADECTEFLPSGRQRRLDNRVAWAKSYLDHAGLLQSPPRGRFQITDRGRAVLQEAPPRLDIAFLQRFEEFREFRRTAIRVEPGGNHGAPDEGLQGRETPEETLEHAYQTIRAELATELLARVKASSPSFFERLVVELLLKMEYGRSRAEAGRAIGGTGDEGLDGVISEDRLGLDTIYIQAKRWQGTVGRPDIQRFVGALHGRRARKGVFLTTGTFSADAVEYVSHIDPRVVLRACLKRSRSVYKTPDHQMDHGDPDPRLGRLRQRLKVFTQPPRAIEPAKRPLDVSTTILSSRH